MGSTWVEAITVFDHAFGLASDDTAHSTDEEERLWLIAESDIGVLVVMFTLRHGAKSSALAARGVPAARRARDMKRTGEFPFERARRVTRREVARVRRAIESRGVGYQTIISEVLLKATG